MVPLTYHGLVRNRVRRVFGLISQGDWEAVLRDTATDVHHVFPGEHALGGERHDRGAVEAWFERLGYLFPVHEFRIQHVASRGWPWDTWAAVSWVAELEPRDGGAYTNHGAHWLRLRWGKVTYIHAYLDTQAVARACEEMAAAGVTEAAAAPIT